jgi:hypothetical protein
MKNKFLPLIIAAVAIGAVAFLIIHFTSPTTGNGSEQGDGEIVKLGDKSSKTPKEWIKEKPASKLRKDQYRVPKVKEDEKEKDGEVAIFEGFGGSNAENVARWKAKFKAPKGKTIDDVSKVEEFKVNGVDVTYVDVSGTYKHQVPPNPAITEFPKYRMLAFIFDAPDERYFVTFVGPENTVAAAKQGFDNWLKGFK